MFNWFKKLHRSAAFASTSAAAELHWNFCCIKAAHGSTARHYDTIGVRATLGEEQHAEKESYVPFIIQKIL
jgi:hypothetical protein